MSTTAFTRATAGFRPVVFSDRACGHDRANEIRDFVNRFPVSHLRESASFGLSLLLANEYEAFRDRFEALAAPPVRELSEADAEREVIAYLATNGRTDSFDMAIALDLDPEFVAIVCAGLASSGRIVEA